MGQLTVAVDAALDVADPINTILPNFQRDNYAVFFVMRDTDYTIRSGLATEWELSDEGFRMTIHPDAKWHSGLPITAEDIKWGFEAMRADYAPEFTGRAGQATELQEAIGDIEVIDDKHVFVRTLTPNASFIERYAGAGYPQLPLGFQRISQGGWPRRLRKGAPGRRAL